MKSYTDISINIDLVASALNHLQFLEECDKHTVLRDERFLRQALYRYQYFWLPLAAKHKKKVLEAPLDIAWVWHCHMLSPASYCADCVRLLDGVIVDHTLERNKSTRSKMLQETKRLWEKEYPNDPFEMDLNTGFLIQQYKNGQTTFSYNILEAAGRQKEFGYQVSLPHYTDKKFLESSLVRYKKFLYLKTQRPNMFIVPCYDIDLMWHTHQLYPKTYKEDTERLFNKIFNHDDSVTDRNEGSKLYNSDLATREAWKEVFSENFALFGAMYRGENPVGKLQTIKPEEIMLMRTRISNLAFERVEMKASPATIGKPRLSVSTAVNSKQEKLISTLKGPKKVWQSKSLFHVNFNTRSVNCLMFSLLDVVGWGFFGPDSEVTIMSTTFDMLPVLEAIPFGQRSTQELITTQHRNFKIDFKVNIGPVKKGPLLLYLKAGLYERAVIPEHLESMWGPIPLPRLPPGAENWCEVASHKVTNHRGVPLFTCRLIHSQPLLQSAVHVFYQDKMVAVGHLVGTDQLPTPIQAKKRKQCVTLNPRAADRAVLIKNHSGDWAAVVGRWIGQTRGVAGVDSTPGRAGRRGVHGNAGTLHVKIWRMKERDLQEVVLSYDRSIYTLSVAGVSIDLKAGVVMVDEHCDDVAEALALAFSISLLHVLCQPRPKDWKPGKTIESCAETRGTKKVTYVPSEDLAFIMAAGFLMAIQAIILWHKPTGYTHALAVVEGMLWLVILVVLTAVVSGVVSVGVVVDVVAVVEVVMEEDIMVVDVEVGVEEEDVVVGVVEGVEAKTHITHSSPAS
ncbi:uncharacterized protein LOC131928710 [Physella acuta]|uniref:uncharacterized protein LOC131928710 n=1 Tax=Physella acuta TaxID=109671 RepID=UPI0027DE2996|nr:uncharacterized protein LOC131928710 [Physella acuta]